MINSLILESLRLYPTDLKKIYAAEYHGKSLDELFDIAATVSLSNEEDKLARLTYLRDTIIQINPRSEVSALSRYCDINFPLVYSESVFSTVPSRLATTEYVPTSLKDMDIKERKYTIFFQPNAAVASPVNADKMMFAHKHGMVVVTFNYKGTWGSEGQTLCSQDLIEDGMAQVQRLLRLGVPAENILLNGHSLGCATATIVAAKLHEEQKRVFLWADRTFSSLYQLAKHLVGHFQVVSNRIINAAINFIAPILTPVVLFFSGWHMDVAGAYKKIPNHYKYHINCLKEEDGLIPKVLSLDYALKSHRHSLKETFKDNQYMTDDLKSAFKAHRFYKSKEHQEDRGHDLSYDDLICADGSGRTASQVLSQFCYNRFKSFHAIKDDAPSKVKRSYGC